MCPISTCIVSGPLFTPQILRHATRRQLTFLELQLKQLQNVLQNEYGNLRSALNANKGNDFPFGPMVDRFRSYSEFIEKIEKLMFSADGRVHLQNDEEHDHLSEQLQKVRPAASIGGVKDDELKAIIIKLREWEEELFRVVDVVPV